MFVSERWVAAFVDSLKAQGGEAEDGYQALKTLSSWVKSLPGAVFGSSAAERLEKLVREAMANASNGNAPKGSDASVGSNASSPALETALRLLVLMVRRNVVHHIDSVLDGVKKYLDRKNGVLAVSLEYAFPPGEDP
ncbi:MAG: hypothetical protein FWC45_01330, partial [Treponema sp.]|nr:hypothetical protein [Treponema sp.]